MASNVRPLLSRLIGLETEYATRVEPHAGCEAEGPSRQSVYEAFCSAIARRQPTARGRFDPSQLFLASGGAITSEADLTGGVAAARRRGGLIEGATPEVRSPSELLAYQRAQDRMFAAAAEDCCLDAEISLLKNGADASHHLYGCQENYEAEVARGGGLIAYRLALFALLPLQLITGALGTITMGIGLGVLVVARCLRLLCRGERPTLETLSVPPPPTTLRLLVILLRLLRIPLMGGLAGVVRGFAFRRQRRLLTAFLVSRIALTGDGHVDRRGKFWLSTKGRGIDQIVGWGSYRGERPIYVFRHWLEQLCDPSMHTFQATVALWKRRQRLQIGLSDSNAADWAEYLKVGATSLVLDLIEAGGGEGLPRLKRPLAALRRIGGDWNLVVDVPTDRGPMSALRIQTAYYEACRRFVEAHPHGHDAEARKVLRVWKASLDAAGAFRRDATAIEPALGRLDWLTKRWMLDQLSADASWETRKKVDLRYHELTAEGYFRRLSEAIPAALLADEAAVSRAYRLPPRDSPAGRRGYLVREFGGCDDSLRVSWSQVVIGHGRHRRVVDLHDDR